MTNIYRLIIFLTFLLLGCAPNFIKENKLMQKIDSLDMNIYSKSGIKIYSITSPNTSYNNNELNFEFKKPTINIFKGEEIKYIINSDESTLSDNNKLLKLKGNVKLKTLKQDKDFLYADYFVWNIEETNYLLEGNIKMNPLKYLKEMILNFLMLIIFMRKLEKNYLTNLEKKNFILKV